MIYRRFGKTGLSMPVISFGCMRSMHSWDDTPMSEVSSASQNNLEEIVTRALSHGINHIETAHGYGSSERQLGQILQRVPRNDYLLQTKVVPSDKPEVFLSKVLQSMDRLGVDRLDLLTLHGINDHRSLWQCCRKNGCLGAARSLQDRGLVDHIGFSGHGPTDVILPALLHEEDGGFDFFNVHWYYIFDQNRQAIECAKDRDIGTFIISPSDKGGHLYSPSPQLSQLCAPLSPMLFNDLYCLLQDGVTTISVGAALPEHFDEHLKVLPYLDQKDRSIFKAIDRRMRSAMRAATGHERPDQFWNQLPPWDQAPGNINLRMTLWLYNLSRGWSMQGYARERYKMLKGGSSWTPGVNAARADTIDFSGMNSPEGLAADNLQELLVKAHQSLT
jgi:predicted aldo/keto reductase-like oxidoreductase